MTDHDARARDDFHQELWLDVVEKDDRTSPEEYPDHALITEEEFKAYLRTAEAAALERAAQAELLLCKIRDCGLIYWEPNTSRGHVSKALMLKEIDEFLSALAVEREREGK